MGIPSRNHMMVQQSGRRNDGYTPYQDALYGNNKHNVRRENP